MVGYVPDVEKLSETRYCGVGTTVIETDEQMLLAQQGVENLQKILMSARKHHSSRDYARLSEPILLELWQRERQIFEYLTRDFEQPVAHV